jgi:hypothetical protein
MTKREAYLTSIREHLVTGTSVFEKLSPEARDNVVRGFIKESRDDVGEALGTLYGLDAPL